MTESWIILSSITFIAAILQIVTGFGFGILAVPVFLLVLNSVSAIHLVTLITLLMSLATLHSARANMIPGVLLALSAGVLVGSPLGIIFFSQFNLNMIKISAALVILFVSLLNAFQYLQRYVLAQNQDERANHGSSGVQFGVGILSGILGATLAMPGPLVMMYLSGTSYTKDEIRSTILVFFVAAYGAALACQVSVQGVELNTWITAASLSPIALLGVWIGHKLSGRVSAMYFRLIVFIILIITSSIMLFTALY